MSDRETCFDELMHRTNNHREKDLVNREEDPVTKFLEESVEAINTRHKETALRTAADFDEFKTRAHRGHDNQFYTKFFTVLSDVIKEFHLDHRNTDKSQPADTIGDTEDTMSTREAVEKALRNDP